MNKKILILVGGPLRKLDNFVEPVKKLGMDVTLASFRDINFFSGSDVSSALQIKVGDKDIKEFSLIYIRMVGKRMEDATLVVNYAKQNGIKIVDGVYMDSLFIPSTISKALEMKKLIDNGIPLPQTFFASLDRLGSEAPKLLGYPFVLKSTSGRKARDAWLIDSGEKWNELYSSLRVREKEGVRFFAQKPVSASQRIRTLVIGGEVVGAITRPTKWRTALTGKSKESGVKEAITSVEAHYTEVSLKAAKAAGLDIAGIDILEEDKTGNLFIIEANAAPAWNLITRDCNVNVEEKVLLFLSKKLS
jgi:glutathione synthase/RimK-type ligase-like ATP-grasp enzyme